MTDKKGREVTDAEFAERNRRWDEQHAKMLAEAKAEAARTGKEPFDLEKVKKLWVLMRPRSEYPDDEEYAELEFDYYTSDARTIVQFAKRLSDFEYWR